MSDQAGSRTARGLQAAALAREVENVVASHAPDLGNASAILSGELIAAIALLPDAGQRALPANRKSILAAFVKHLNAAYPTGDHDKEAALSEEISDEGISVDDWAGRTAGPTYLEKHYGIARSTLYRWQKRSLVVALRRGGRKYVFPLEQFIDGRPVAGLKQITEIFGHPRLAWAWLRTPNAALSYQPPLALLAIDRVESVIAAANHR